MTTAGSEGRALRERRYERVRELMPHLLFVQAVVFFDADCQQWAVIGKEIWQGAQGSTRADALRAFRGAFVADALIHADPEVAAGPSCPDEEWFNLLKRDRAQVVYFGFDEVQHKPRVAR